MKRIGFLLMMMAASLTIMAEKHEFSNGLYWELENGVLTISGKGAMNNYIYPWRDECNIQKIVIEDGVTSIGETSFWEYNKPHNLKTVIIPNSVTTIGERAFFDCSNLTSVTIPYSVTKIGSRAFYGCSSLTSITIPNSVTTIGEGAFAGCSSLKSVIISNSASSIEYMTFYKCSSLTSVTIPYSVTSIEDYAFDGCSSLASIKILNPNTTIGTKSFDGCVGRPILSSSAGSSKSSVSNLSSSDLAVFDLKGKVKSCTLNTPESTSSYLASMIKDDVLRFDETGKLSTSKSIKREENGRLDKYEKVNILYNTDGRLKSLFEITILFGIMKEDYEITYRDNRIVEQKWTLDNDKPVITKFQYTKFDNIGNWIERISTRGSSKYTERRTITYY